MYSDEIDQAEQQIRSDEPVGDLRINLPLAFGTDQIVPQLPGFVRRFPRLNLHVSLSDEPVSLLRDRFDVVVRMGQCRTQLVAGVEADDRSESSSVKPRLIGR